jgi:hypothetical protein
MGKTSHCKSEFGGRGIFPLPISWWHGTNGATKREFEISSNVGCRARDNFVSRDREVKPLIAVWSAICCGNSVVNSIVPPGWAQGLLIVEEAADPFDEGLNLPFNWVLMLVAGGGWSHGDAVAFLKSSSGGQVVFRRARVTANVTNMMTMLAIKPDDLFRGTEERGARFIFDEDCVAKPAEQVFEEEKTIIPANRDWADGSLIINTQRFSGK